jgi:hypothetical protein
MARSKMNTDTDTKSRLKGGGSAEPESAQLADQKLGLTGYQYWGKVIDNITAQVGELMRQRDSITAERDQLRAALQGAFRALRYDA